MSLEIKKPLEPAKDVAHIHKLKQQAIDHRRMLLQLGRRMSIRLHYGASMSAVEILTILYRLWLKIDPQHPCWEQRDRFILSKGHAAPSLYVTLSIKGFFSQNEFADFRTLHSILQGHPDRTKTPGVDCSTGSLGQGLPVACGMALGGKMGLSPFRVYALIGDGECNEGSIWEAALIASNLALDNLIVLLDRNKQSSYGGMQQRNDVEPLLEKWQAFGWDVSECDGHDFVALTRALSHAESVKKKPSVIICHTIKGCGIPYAETHRVRSNFALTEEQYQEAMAFLNAQEAKLRNDNPS